MNHLGSGFVIELIWNRSEADGGGEEFVELEAVDDGDLGDACLGDAGLLVDEPGAFDSWQGGADGRFAAEMPEECCDDLAAARVLGPADTEHVGAGAGVDLAGGPLQVGWIEVTGSSAVGGEVGQGFADQGRPPDRIMRGAMGDGCACIEAHAAHRRLELAYLLGIESAEVGGSQGEKQIGLGTGAAWAACDQAVPLELAQLGLERQRPRAGVVAQVGGATERPPASQVQIAVGIPEDEVQPLQAEGSRVLADPAHVMDRAPEPGTPEAWLERICQALQTI